MEAYLNWNINLNKMYYFDTKTANPKNVNNFRSIKILRDFIRDQNVHVHRIATTVHEFRLVKKFNVFQDFEQNPFQPIQF